VATTKPVKPTKRDLTSEAAPRQRDPFEVDYLGIIRGNDPLLRDRGETIDAYIDLLRDGKVFSSINRRVGALVSRPWAVEPINTGDTASAEALTEILRRIPFDQLCRDLLGGALIGGYAVAEIVWSVVDGRWLPMRFPVRKPRRFVYVDDDDGRGPQLRLLVKEDMLRGEPLPERKFIVHRVNPRDDNPYGTGLGLQLFWPVYFKRAGILAWSKFIDRFGTPTVWGRYPVASEAKDKKTLMEALRAFSADGCVMTPEGALIDLLEANGSGNVTTQEALVRAMDSAIAETILGQETGEHSGGALAAAAKERADVRLDLVQADADLLSETLNSTLIAWLCDFNGIGPCNVYRQIKEEVDLKVASETDKNVADLGFELSEEAARAKYGDGWSKKLAGIENPTQAVPKFAEHGNDAPDSGDAAEKSLPQLMRESGPALQQWIDEIETMLDAAGSLSEFREMLVAAYPKLDNTALVATLSAAFAALDLRGRYEVAAKTGGAA
jgi:phage gp29-like protein